MKTPILVIIGILSIIGITPALADSLLPINAQLFVKYNLRDPDSAKFTDIQVYREDDEEAGTVCGYVNSRNGLGGMTGPIGFIFINRTLIFETETRYEFMKRNLCHE